MHISERSSLKDYSFEWAKWIQDGYVIIQLQISKEFRMVILKVEEATKVSNYFDWDLYFDSSTETITETESFNFLRDREVLY